jgi:hypothetical protein
VKRVTRKNPLATVADIDLAIGAELQTTFENIVGNYKPETLALFDRMAVRPDFDRRAAIDTLVSALLEYDLWGRLDGLYVFAAHTSQAALLNWRRDAANMTAVNSPTFTEDLGFTGDGVSSSLTNTSAATVNTQATDGMVALWVPDAGTATTTFDLWWTNWGYALDSNRNSTQSAWRAAVSSTRSVTSGHIGLFAATRRSSTAAYAYLDGAKIDTNTSAYDNTLSYVTAAPIRILSENGSSVFTDSTVSFAAYGASMTEVEMALFYNAVSDYMTAVGVV